ncbi:MAG: tetratricopeptide repeat protein [Armatimonadetes bacterium]|nr:tetratricopeptide repeat protein [Armatimonadota bacterium]
MSKGRSQTPDMVRSASAPVPQKRRPHRAALFVGGVIAVVLALAAVLPGAWRETQRRETYLPQLEAQARRHPEDGRLLALLGARLTECGEYRAAADALRQALAAGEQGEAVWQALAADSAAAGEPGKAVADLRLGIKTLSHVPLLQTALDQARALPPTASPMDLARTISPQGPEPLLAVYARGSFLNGVVSWWGRHHPEASGFATRQAWAARQPGNAQAQRLWAQALMQNRRLPEAEAAAERAVSLAPDSPDAHLALADALAREGRLETASRHYLVCLQFRPNWLPALLGLGAAFAASDLKGYAASTFTRATQVAPRSADAWVGLGRTLRLTGADYDKSIAAFGTAARLAPARTDYFVEYADALRQNHQWDQAEAVLRRRVADAPDDALAHVLLGRLLMDNNPTPARVASAEAETREALRLSPHDPTAEAQLGQLLLERGQVAEAVGALSDALTRDPFDRNTMLLLARAFRRSGRNDLAQRVSQQAAILNRDRDQAEVLEDRLRDNGRDIGVRRQLADLYDRTGEPGKAQQERLLIRRLQTDPQKAVQDIHSLESSFNAVLSTH